MEDADKQEKKQRIDYIKEYQWQKGQSGNPAGRPKGKTMKEFAREFLSNMSEDARLAFLKSLESDIIWKMAEGNPHNTEDITSGGKPIPLLNALPNNNSNKEDTQPDKKD